MQIATRDPQIGVLLDQLREANARLALPAPANGRPWWKLWKTSWKDGACFPAWLKVHSIDRAPITKTGIVSSPIQSP